jgi:ABC-type sugar transport system permease subunit
VRRTALSIAALLVVIDVAAIALWFGLGAHRALAEYPGEGRDVAYAVVTGEDDRPVVLTATSDNRLALTVDGTVTARRQVDETVGSLAAAPDGRRFYVGTTLGTVMVLDERLQDVDQIDVGDAVVGLHMLENGDLLVAHGSGAFSSRYVVDRFRPGNGEPAARGRAVFTVTGLAANGESAVYGTINSRVGLLDLSASTGRELWTVNTLHPVATLATASQRSWILVGDRAGGLELLARDGGSLGRVQIGPHPVTAVTFHDPTGTILVGDQRGEVVALDERGQIRFRRTTGSGAIRAIAPAGDRMLVVPESGPWSTLDPTAIGAAGTLATLRPWWIGTNIAGLLAMSAVLALGAERRRHQARVVWRRAWAGRLGYVLILPTLGLLAVFTFYPAVNAFIVSFTNFSLRSAPAWVGLENYRRLFTDDVYFRVGLVNMAIITFASFLKTVTVPLLAAELVYWLRNRTHQYVFRTLFVMSSVVPALVLTLLWRQVYDPASGLLNELLSALGLEEWRRAWLGDESTALWAVIGVGFPYLTAFAFLIFLGGLLTIDRALYDAAAIDGAGRWKRFVHVDLPHLRPQFRIMTFFAVVGAIEGFASIFVLTRGGPGYATYVPALQMYERIGTGDLGYASAIGVVLFLMVLVVTVFVLRFRRSELEQ